MVINGIILHGEGFVMLLSFMVSGLWIYSSRRKVNHMSAKVAFILDSKFNLTTEDLLKPYYFGNLDEESRKLKEEVKNHLFENGIPLSFLNSGLISKHVNEWKKLGYLN